ncbi:MexE family multidrug efflux RND transporter periplasmic adaptor subunit [Agaricicola taiwanensis]|uniref:MexE family multidrug efflux RND transporter periplasmic adaptor subunit n=1 Tax=Agaricicola taiwanensis TaxID=591372 RepID=A0A8J2VIW5_9RHOB|nr:efflux RND transporter periplasmic adaptor subunit [Agaricicola taiwanensis]GGE31101.1 MexE family multidrug efflux RND transporter periplasmic adaptor subunit [Agaricicola taiwanensis]
MSNPQHRKHRRYVKAAAAIALSAAVAAAYFGFPEQTANAQDPAAAPAATPVSVASVTSREIKAWDEFSGRLEAVERVDVRSRVAGAVLAAHFREGALVRQGDLLVTIDPEPYAAEVERQQAAVTAAEARLELAKTELDRGKQLVTSRVVSVSELDQRANAFNEARANLDAAKAALRTAQLNLDYTAIRAPVSGRVGRLEVTVGNLVAAGPGAPVLTTLVSVDPIYVSFNADEQVVAKALASLSAEANKRAEVEDIPVEISTINQGGERIPGHLQFVDNQVDVSSGTVRMRAVFDNPDGLLMAGQFARVHLGQIRSEQAVAVSERAIGTDQDKRFVIVVEPDNKAAYREVRLGRVNDGLRVVTSGLKAGERIVVNGLHRVRPGTVVDPQMVAMEGGSEKTATANNDVVAR